MWKQERNVKINKIWYDFSDAVSGEEVAAWENEIRSQFQGSLINLEENFVLWQQEMQEKEHQGIILITDRPGRCREASPKDIPFLYYLHEQNQQESIGAAPYAIMGLQEIQLTELERVYQRFKNIPWTILETERCIVRELTEDDIEDLYQVYADPSISQYTEGLYEDKEKELAYLRDYIRQVYGFCGYGVWAIIDKKSGNMIGRAGLAAREGFDLPELGYVIAVPYQRQGYATEVCRAILDYTFTELNFTQVRALIQKGNEASRRLCLKLGFQEDCELEIDGTWMQQYLYTKAAKGEKESEEQKEEGTS
jgi:RimJ/RimL family protein N-acetyltransferase